MGLWCQTRHQNAQLCPVTVACLHGNSSLLAMLGPEVQHLASVSQPWQFRVSACSCPVTLITCWLRWQGLHSRHEQSCRDDSRRPPDRLLLCRQHAPCHTKCSSHLRCSHSSCQANPCNRLCYKPTGMALFCYKCATCMCDWHYVNVFPPLFCNSQPSLRHVAPAPQYDCMHALTI